MQDEFILKMKKIVKTFPGVKALSQVDFNVRWGEVHCLIGANGAGKSTLMKILSGAYTEDKGEIYFDNVLLKSHGTEKRRKEGISVIYQELSLFNELSVAENVYINNYPKTALGAVDWKKTYEMAQELADGLNIKIHARAKVSSLNMGQRQLTEIMKALACNARLIVMDEPSSTLSQSEFEILVKVIRDLKEKGITIIYISHHLEELFIVGDRITVLRDGKSVICKKCDELTEDSLVEYMTGIQISKIESEESQVHKVSEEVVLELDKMCNSKVSDISFRLHRGEVLGLYGLVGAGRTEILQSIYGLRPSSGGRILVHGKNVKLGNAMDAICNKIGMAPESRKTQGLVLVLPVWENMSMAALRRFKKGAAIQYSDIAEECRSYVEKLNIKTPTIWTTTGSLSGGNQQKVILAKWLMKDCDILLLDEPTQGIDVVAKEEIYKLIREMTKVGKSIIVVSSELSELLRVSDNIHVIYDGRQVMETNRVNFNADQILHASVIGRNTK